MSIYTEDIKPYFVIGHREGVGPAIMPVTDKIKIDPLYTAQILVTISDWLINHLPEEKQNGFEKLLKELYIGCMEERHQYMEEIN
jgi:hypothetical protein